MSGFDSRVRLVATEYAIGKSDGLGSPERYPSSHDVVIACVVSSQKRGVDMTRGNYVSANNMGRYSVEGSGPDCKSGVTDSVGSIPTRPTIRLRTVTVTARS